MFSALKSVNIANSTFEKMKLLISTLQKLLSLTSSTVSFLKVETTTFQLYKRLHCDFNFTKDKTTGRN